MNAKSSNLRLQIIVLTLIRLIYNTAFRMVYPFLPEMSRGLGVERQAIARAISARAAFGLSGPLLGPLVDRWGRKAAMLVALGLGGLAFLMVALKPTYSILFAGLILFGIGKTILDPSMHAYLGDRIEYHRRGVAIAILEMSWSGAYLIGIPVVGLLIARSGWSDPFLWLALLIFGSAVVLWQIIPSDIPHPEDVPPLTQGIQVILKNPAALAGLALGMCISASNEVISIIYSEWLEQSFALSVATLGAATAVIGLAEWGGEGLVAAFVDRVGKRRSVILGIGLNILMTVSLLLLGRSLIGALISLFLIYLTFEFTLVSALPLMTELAPSARATLMASNVSALYAGRMLGSLIGFPLFESGGLGFTVIPAVVFDVIALAALLIFIRQE
jgi:DHA1 family inner membrane transport protein